MARRKKNTRPGDCTKVKLENNISAYAPRTSPSRLEKTIIIYRPHHGNLDYTEPECPTTLRLPLKCPFSCRDPGYKNASNLAHCGLRGKRFFLHSTYVPSGHNIFREKTYRPAQALHRPMLWAHQE